MTIDNPDEFVHEFLKETMEVDREFKVAICANGPEDMPTRILYMRNGDRKTNMVIPMQMGGPRLIPADLISMTVGLLAKQLGKPFLIAYADEVIGKFFPPGHEDEVPKERGVLTEMFKKGDPETWEALSIISVHRREDGTLRQLAVQQPFHFDDGTVIFGDEEWTDSLEEGTFQRGAVAEALINAFGSEQN